MRFHQARMFSSQRTCSSKISGFNATKKVRWESNATSAQPAIMPYKCESMFINRHTCVYITSFTSNKQKFSEMGTYKCNSSFELGNVFICIASKLLQCFASHASFAVFSEPILQFLVACRSLNFKQDQSVDGAIDVFIRVVLEKLVGGYVTMEQRRIIGELLLQVVSNVP